MKRRGKAELKAVPENCISHEGGAFWGCEYLRANARSIPRTFLSVPPQRHQAWQRQCYGQHAACWARFRDVTTGAAVLECAQFCRAQRREFIKGLFGQPSIELAVLQYLSPVQRSC